MAEFQRKTVPFVHGGMNWNMPVDKLDQNQFSWCKNVRVLGAGTISTAHGYTLPNPAGDGSRFDGVEYLHSISRLNILNQASTASGAPHFDPNLQRTHVVGGDQKLFVFQDQPTLDTPDLNPVFINLPENADTATPQTDIFSGNPLSIVDAQPAGAAVAWKYIGDSKRMRKVGYYPGDVAGGTMARCLPIGLRQPVMSTDVTVATLNPGETGQLNGNYQWCFAYRDVQTGARSNPSAATRHQVGGDLTDPDSLVSVHLVNQAAHMILPPVPRDPQSPSNQFDNNIVVDVYRFGGSVLRWALVGTGPGDSEFIDNNPDINLLTAPAPPQATDSITGQTRFNLYQPFVTQDIARQGTATLSMESNGVWVLTSNPVAGTDNFNPNWLMGSTIYVGATGAGAPKTAYTIYQVRDATHLELADDLSLGPYFDGQAVNWATNAGTLMSGQPMAHIWGPYGVGQTGSYIFACGDPNARGTLYWTNGNDPDSTDVVNNIVVTSPSEQLMTGCVYDGNPFCWSTERQFQIFPSLTLFGQFTSQEVAGAKGVWLEYSLSIQSNGLADQSVTWRGKDGIYDWGAGTGLRRLSDPLYPFFPHDNSPGIAPETILPFIRDTETVGNLDDTRPKYHRLCWFHGLLFYDFPALAEDPFNPLLSLTHFSTLVYDSVNTAQGGGWVSLDQPFQDTFHPVARGIDIGANNLDPKLDVLVEPPFAGPMTRGGNLKVSWGNLLYDYYGYTRGFESRVITRAEDLGDPRAQKRWGDYWLDCTPLNEFTITPLAGFHRCKLLPLTVPSPATTPSDAAITPDFCARQQEPGQRAQFICDFLEFRQRDGAALMSPTLGLDIRWHGADGQFVATINQWAPSYVPKPEVISFRASDPDDMGQLQAKYFTGLNLEANTFGQDLKLNVMLDSYIRATLDVNHNGQSEKPYSFATPYVGYLAQMQMEFPQSVNGEPPTWQYYKSNWIYEVWPDSTSRASFYTDLGYTGSKFIQGMVIPMETGGQSITFDVKSDCGQSVTMGPVSTPFQCKMDLAFSFGPCNNSPSDPFIGSVIQVQPNDDARFWYDQIKWIWEPEPELVATWLTQPTDHDFATWHHHRDCFIAYRGGNGTPTLYITTEYGTEAYPLDPVTPNQYVRAYRVLKPQKAKWRYYRVEGCGKFRLYIKDSVVRVKEWGSTGPYVNTQPFGDLSRVNGAPGGAKI